MDFFEQNYSKKAVSVENRKSEHHHWNLVLVVVYLHSQQIYICFVFFGSINNKFFSFCKFSLFSFSFFLFVKECMSFAETSASKCFLRNGQIVKISYENVLALFMSLFIAVRVVVPCATTDVEKYYNIE